MLGRAILVTLSIALTAIVPPSAAQPIGAGFCRVNPEAPPIDNRDGYFVNRKEAPIHPMESSHAGTELWVANPGDGRISVFKTRSQVLQPQRIAELPGCLGPVTIRRRPLQPAPEQLEPPEGVSLLSCCRKASGRGAIEGALGRR